MRERVYESARLFVAICFYYSGLVKLAHWWIQRSGQRLIILYYHRATGGDLRSQLLYLRRHYRILHLEEALQELYAPLDLRKSVCDRRTPLVLTFDDGYRDNYTYGFALARELQVPITIFLIPGYLESGACFWWVEVDHLVRQAHAKEVIIEGHRYHLNEPQERKELAQTIDTRVRYAKSVGEREAFLTMVREALGVNSRIAEEEALRPLTWAEVHEMEESGWVSFGAHTMHHPRLGCLAESTEVRREVGECRSVLEQQLGHPVNTFAYPMGDFGGQGLCAVKAAGYRWALTTIEEVNTPQSNPHLLRRIPGVVDQHWLILASELVDLLGNVSRLRKKLRKIFSRRLGVLRSYMMSEENIDAYFQDL
jgi:peptidoglycan/xylan/chitin deacetylase (PgdA/CDA1 family)